MFTGLAQLVEHWSPKPGAQPVQLKKRGEKFILSVVEGSLSTRA